MKWMEVATEFANETAAAIGKAGSMASASGDSSVGTSPAKSPELWAIANKKPHSVRSYKEGLRRFAESFSGNVLVRFRRFLSKGLANAESRPGSVSG